MDTCYDSKCVNYNHRQPNHCDKEVFAKTCAGFLPLKDKKAALSSPFSVGLGRALIKTTNRSNKMKKVLLKDIVIPKGTVLNIAPTKTERVSDDFYSATVGLSKNTCGDFTYCISDDPEIMAEYFTDLKE